MKLIANLLFFFIPVFLFAQESEIIISEANLQQLATKLYQLKLERQNTNASIFSDTDFLNREDVRQNIHLLRRKNIVTENTSVSEEMTLLRAEVALLKEFLMQEKNQLQGGSSTSKSASTEQKSSSQSAEETIKKDEEVLLQLNEISSALKALEQQQNLNSAPNEERIIVNVPRSTTQTLVVPTERRASSDTLYINNLGTPKDSLDLLSDAKRNRQMQEQENALAKITTQLHLLHQKIDQLYSHLEVDSETQIVEVEKIIEVEKINTIEDEEYRLRKEKFGAYSLQIFFANNSFQLDEQYNKEIRELGKELNEEPKIDVVIEGYASARGDALYNEELSMKRAIALKRKLMGLGIAPKRILTDYKGVDKNATKESEARRLDIRFLVRE